jgi:hypothetical protein
MGYTTDFSGAFSVSPPLKAEHRTYLKLFNETRRMKRDPRIADTLPDPVREATGLSIGPEGDFFVGGAGFMGQNHDASVLNYNDPPDEQPGLWCKWTPNDAGTEIQWDEGEKFYDYVEWLEYLIKHFLAPWGYQVNGKVRWCGESTDDCGVITVKDNHVTTRELA